MYLSYLKKRHTTVDYHEDRKAIGMNSLPLATAQSGGLSADEVPFAQAPGGGAAAGAFNDSFFGQTMGMVARPGGTNLVFLACGLQGQTRG